MAFRAWQWPVTGLSALAATFLAAHPAIAHPHVFPVVTITVQFDDAGRFSGVHEKWSFDYDYSGVVKSTIDKDGDGSASPDELTAALGMDGVLSWLALGDYMTRLTLGGRPVARGEVKDPDVKFYAGKLLIEFTVPLKEPQPATLGAGVDVFDAEFYYDVEFDYPDVEATGTPASCQVTRREKDNLDPVAIMIIRKLGLTADPKVLSDPASGYAVRVAIDCK
jgi:ABC-type uncharacterized transport system substrate-binding protein